MRKGLVIAGLLVVLFAGVLGTTGCTRVLLEDVEGPSGVETKNASIPLDGAERLDARITMPVGEFTLTGGGTGAMDAVFTHSRDWVPRTEYSVESSTGVLRVDQPAVSERIPFGQKANQWDIRLASAIPVDLNVELGAGQSEIDLRDVDVDKLDVLTGVGETTIDLSGARTHDVTARIEAGLGQLTVRVPRGIGVRLTSISDGIGDFSAEGLHRDGSDYVNDAYATSTTKMEITLHRGIGEVRVVSVP